MIRFNRKKKEEVNSSSMADIAFLLLIFFLVTTTIQSDKGLSMKLPPESDETPAVNINDRNLFKILINSEDRILVEDVPFQNLEALSQALNAFILNKGKDPNLSDSPEDAIISLKVDRGTSYKAFIEMLDALQGVYYDIYGSRVGLSAETFRNLNRKLPEDKARYEAGRKGIPMNISIAEPNNVVL